MNTTRETIKGKRGSILPFVLVALVALVALAFALNASGLRNLLQVFRSKQTLSAYYAAQAGLAGALYAVQAGDASLPSGCGLSDSPENLSNRILSNGARFTVTVTSNHRTAGLACAGNATAPDGTPVPPGFLYISSVGRMGGVTRTSNEMLAMYSRFPPFFALTDQRIRIEGGGSTDSYDSSQGILRTLLSTASEGNLGTNASFDGAVTLGLGMLVQGKIWVGPGGTSGPPTVVTQSPTLSYDISSFKHKWILIAPSDPLGGPGTVNVTLPLGAQILTPGRYGNVEVSGTGVLTLSCGAYSMGSLVIRPQGQLVIPEACSSYSPVTLRVYHELDLSGGGVTNLNINQEAGSFILYGMRTLSGVKLPVGPRAVLSLYAPFADIQAGSNTEIYGALIGKSLSASGTGCKFHFDEALPRTQAVIPLAVVKAWSSEY